MARRRRYALLGWVFLTGTGSFPNAQHPTMGLVSNGASGSARKAGRSTRAAGTVLET